MLACLLDRLCRRPWSEQQYSNPQSPAKSAPLLRVSRATGPSDTVGPPFLVFHAGATLHKRIPFPQSRALQQEVKAEKKREREKACAKRMVYRAKSNVLAPLAHGLAADTPLSSGDLSSPRNTDCAVVRPRLRTCRVPRARHRQCCSGHSAFIIKRREIGKKGKEGVPTLLVPESFRRLQLAGDSVANGPPKLCLSEPR